MPLNCQYTTKPYERGVTTVLTTSALQIFGDWQHSSPEGVEKSLEQYYRRTHRNHSRKALARNEPSMPS